jgi:hypothetical protein
MTDEKNYNEVDRSVADRVLAAFIAALDEDEDLAEVAPRLKIALLDTEDPKEDALRKALFGEGEA